ncbi:MAG TPA: carbohydrate kinase family protein [Acidobacteriota bacterium]|nr:carbohydrate kinase family protein [Acidobacteriota bacterium]
MITIKDSLGIEGESNLMTQFQEIAERRVVVAGHICLDIIPDLGGVITSAADFLRPGKLMQVGSAVLSTGGPVSNTGLALVTLGVPASLMGKVGDDCFGDLIVSLLQRRGAGEGMLAVPGEASSYTVALSPPGLDRMFLHCPGANNTFRASDIPYDVVAKADLFHFGYPPLMSAIFAEDGRELVEIFRRVKATGTTTSLDMSMPDPDSSSGTVNWRRVLSDVLPYVDIFLPSVEETLFMLERDRYDAYHSSCSHDMLSLVTGDDLSRLSSILLNMGGRIVGLKCGERGFYLRTAGRTTLQSIGRARPGGDLGRWANREVWEPSFHVMNYAGATGSGDSAIAGFLSAFLRGHKLESCLRYACAVGAFNVTAPDALSGLKSWEETIERVRAGWEKNPLEPASSGWWQDEAKMWHGPCDEPALGGGDHERR